MAPKKRPAGGAGAAGKAGLFAPSHEVNRLRDIYAKATSGSPKGATAAANRAKAEKQLDEYAKQSGASQALVKMCRGLLQLQLASSEDDKEKQRSALEEGLDTLQQAQELEQTDGGRISLVAATQQARALLSMPDRSQPEQERFFEVLTPAILVGCEALAVNEAAPDTLPPQVSDPRPALFIADGKDGQLGLRHALQHQVLEMRELWRIAHKEASEATKQRFPGKALNPGSEQVVKATNDLNSLKNKEKSKSDRAETARKLTEAKEENGTFRSREQEAPAKGPPLKRQQQQSEARKRAEEEAKKREEAIGKVMTYLEKTLTGDAEERVQKLQNETAMKVSEFEKKAQDLLSKDEKAAKGSAAPYASLIGSDLREQLACLNSPHEWFYTTDCILKEGQGRGKLEGEVEDCKLGSVEQYMQHVAQNHLAGAPSLRLSLDGPEPSMQQVLGRDLADWLQDSAMADDQSENSVDELEDGGTSTRPSQFAESLLQLCGQDGGLAAYMKAASRVTMSVQVDANAPELDEALLDVGESKAQDARQREELKTLLNLCKGYALLMLKQGVLAVEDVSKHEAMAALSEPQRICLEVLLNCGQHCMDTPVKVQFLQKLLQKDEVVQELMMLLQDAGHEDLVLDAEESFTSAASSDADDDDIGRHSPHGANGTSPHAPNGIHADSNGSGEAIRQHLLSDNLDLVLLMQEDGLLTGVLLQALQISVALSMEQDTGRAAIVGSSIKSTVSAMHRLPTDALVELRVDLLEVVGFHATSSQFWHKAWSEGHMRNLKTKFVAGEVAASADAADGVRLDRAFYESACSPGATWPTNCCHTASFMEALLEGKDGSPVSPATLHKAKQHITPTDEEHNCNYSSIIPAPERSVGELRALLLPKLSAEGQPKPGTPEGEAALLESLFTHNSSGLEESRELKEYRREVQRANASKHSDWAQQTHMLKLAAGLAMHRRELSKVLRHAVQLLAAAEKLSTRHGSAEGNGYAGMTEREDELTNQLQDAVQALREARLQPHVWRLKYLVESDKADATALEKEKQRIDSKLRGGEKEGVGSEEGKAGKGRGPGGVAVMPKDLKDVLDSAYSEACQNMENTNLRCTVNEHRLAQLEEKRLNLRYDPGFERSYFELEQDMGDHLVSALSTMMRALVQPSPGKPYDLTGAVTLLQESVDMARWGLFELDAMVECCALSVQGEVFATGTGKAEVRPIVLLVQRVLQSVLEDKAAIWQQNALLDELDAQPAVQPQPKGGKAAPKKKKKKGGAKPAARRADADEDADEDADDNADVSSRGAEASSSAVGGAAGTSAAAAAAGAATSAAGDDGDEDEDAEVRPMRKRQPSPQPAVNHSDYDAIVDLSMLAMYQGGAAADEDEGGDAATAAAADDAQWESITPEAQAEMDEQKRRQDEAAARGAAAAAQAAQQRGQQPFKGARLPSPPPPAPQQQQQQQQQQQEAGKRQQGRGGRSGAAEPPQQASAPARQPTPQQQARQGKEPASSSSSDYKAVVRCRTCNKLHAPNQCEAQAEQVGSSPAIPPSQTQQPAVRQRPEQPQPQPQQQQQQQPPPPPVQAREPPAQPKEQQPPQSQEQCAWCGLTGHGVTDCPTDITVNACAMCGFHHVPDHCRDKCARCWRCGGSGHSSGSCNRQSAYQRELLERGLYLAKAAASTPTGPDAAAEGARRDGLVNAILEAFPDVTEEVMEPTALDAVAAAPDWVVRSCIQLGGQEGRDKLRALLARYKLLAVEIAAAVGMEDKVRLRELSVARPQKLRLGAMAYNDRQQWQQQQQQQPRQPGPSRAGSAAAPVPPTASDFPQLPGQRAKAAAAAVSSAPAAVALLAQGLPESLRQQKQEARQVPGYNQDTQPEGAVMSMNHKKRLAKKRKEQEQLEQQAAQDAHVLPGDQQQGPGCGRQQALPEGERPPPPPRNAAWRLQQEQQLYQQQQQQQQQQQKPGAEKPVTAPVVSFGKLSAAAAASPPPKPPTPPVLPMSPGFVAGSEDLPGSRAQPPGPSHLNPALERLMGEQGPPAALGAPPYGPFPGAAPGIPPVTILAQQHQQQQRPPPAGGWPPPRPMFASQAPQPGGQFGAAPGPVSGPPPGLSPAERTGSSDSGHSSSSLLPPGLQAPHPGAFGPPALRAPMHLAPHGAMPPPNLPPGNAPPGSAPPVILSPGAVPFAAPPHLPPHVAGQCQGQGPPGWGPMVGAGRGGLGPMPPPPFPGHVPGQPPVQQGPVPVQQGEESGEDDMDDIMGLLGASSANEAVAAAAAAAPEQPIVRTMSADAAPFKPATAHAAAAAPPAGSMSWLAATKQGSGSGAHAVGYSAQEQHMVELGPGEQVPGGEASEDDEALQAALELSMKEQGGRQETDNGQFAHLGSLMGSGSAGAVAFSATIAEDVPGPNVSAAGLRNEAGEYNCFLNVAIQCLWHCEAFRDRVMMGELRRASGHHAVVGALVRLFEAMQGAEEDWQLGQKRRVVDPTELREALDKRENTTFRLREMNDAPELLHTIYNCCMEAEEATFGQLPAVPDSKGHAVDAVFGLRLAEALECRKCHMRTHVRPTHMEHMHVATAAALRHLAVMYDDPDMGQLLKEVMMQELKFCDKDEGGCGTPAAPSKVLELAPKVFTLQLAWDLGVDGQEIAATMRTVGEWIDVSRLYARVEGSAGGVYKLTSMICYYGQHYMAMVLNEELGEWLLFDDAKVSRVGDWEAVALKCQAGRIQPSLLFFTESTMQDIADGQALSSSTATATAAPAGLSSTASSASSAPPLPQQQQGQQGLGGAMSSPARPPGLVRPGPGGAPAMRSAGMRPHGAPPVGGRGMRPSQPHQHGGR